MAFMPWGDALKIGIDSIDEQHRWLVDATNALHDELQRDEPRRAVIGEILEGLVDYTMNHFIAEEALFQRLGYPDSPGHLAEHNRFTAGALDLLQRFESGQAVSQEALDFLKNWLTHHILEVDRAYVPFLQSRGVT
ncbi:bacteriohemerythrin [Oryzomicrobium sp.]|uniref:bacteriohemerythrin n=1 Tax=Oryzomicrobium sp. TaxID=1911578 RepID=UPI0025FB461B|nr:bacteriohemerythrin [Oryzomicrobium sp.]MCE1244646.1 bacteriohemerythrin [Oryzomicrobium sp.]